VSCWPGGWAPTGWRPSPRRWTPSSRAELTRASLITEPTPGRYTWHDLLRAYATELAAEDLESERRAALNRLLDHYTHTAHAAARLLDPARDPIALVHPQPATTPEGLTDHGQAMAWFTAEYPVLLAAVDHAAATGFDTHTWQLAWTLRTFLDRRGHWHDWVAVQQAAVAAAERLGDPAARARAHLLLAFAHSKLGRYDEARTQLQHALHVTVQAGDLAGQARTHHNFVHLWGRQGRYSEALDHAHHELDLYRATGNRHGHARALNAIGWCHAELGNHRQALVACQEALPLLQEYGDRLGEAATWDSLGYAHHRLGDHAQAITCYQRAIDVYHDIGDRYYQAETLSHLGDTQRAAGNPQPAKTAWQQALAILDELDHPESDQVRAKLATLDRPPSAG
jgi:tetratricopeptide (TPR) repeat protein